MVYLKLDIQKIEERYIIYKDGKIFDMKTKKYCKRNMSKNGCHKVYLSNIKKHIYVDRLVMCKYAPMENEIYLQVIHKNGIKTDSRFENLEWCEQPECQDDNRYLQQMNKKNNKTYSKPEYSNQCKIQHMEMEKNLLKDLKSNIDINILAKKYRLSKIFIRDFKYRNLGEY